MTTTLIFWGIFLLLGIVMLVYYVKSGKPIRNSFKGMASGAVFLVLTHFFGGIFGIEMPLNLFNCMVSLVLGIPGIILIILSKFI